jgi:hypothetical protein
MTRWLVLAVLVAACGDDSSGVNGDGGAEDAAAARDGATLDSAVRDSAPPDVFLTSDGGACPNLVGSYTVSTVGDGCGTLNASAPQCVQGLSPCSIHFVSSPATGVGAVNGGATLTADGSFTNANLIFGTGQRSGCTGSWDAANNKLIANCGGFNPSTQSCTVTMIRTSATCP